MKQNHFQREQQKNVRCRYIHKKRNKGKIECVFSHFKLFNTMPTHLFLDIIYMHIRTETDKLPLVTRLKQIIQPLLAFLHMQWVVLQATKYDAPKHLVVSTVILSSLEQGRAYA